MCSSLFIGPDYIATMCVRRQKAAGDYIILYLDYLYSIARTEAGARQKSEQTIKERHIQRDIL